jgi:hypothetical protein
LDRGRYREVERALARILSERASQLWVRDQAQHGARELGLVAERKDQARLVVAHELEHRRDVGDHHGFRGHHRFEQHVRTSFRARGQENDIAGGIKRGHIGDEAEKGDVIEPELPCFSFARFAFGPFARHQDANLWVKLLQIRGKADDLLWMFAARQTPGIADDDARRRWAIAFAISSARSEHVGIDAVR